MHEHFTRDQQIAWAAGLFEGEGCIIFAARVSVRLVLGMTDRDVVEQFAAVVGCGKIRESERPNGHKTIHLWEIARAAEVVEVIALLRPFFGQRREERIAAALERLSRNRGASRVRAHCPEGHAYSMDNTYWYRGNRQCLTCRRARAVAQMRQKRALARGVKAEAGSRRVARLSTYPVHPAEGTH